MTAESEMQVGPQRHRWQFSLRTLLLLPVIVATILGMAVSRIERNRLQREAVHDLWLIGAGTAFGPGDIFYGPGGGVAMAMHQRKNWLDNLLGTLDPCAVLFNNDHYEYDAKEIAKLLHGVPSIKHAFFSDNIISKEELDRLRLSVPDVQIHHIPTKMGAGVFYWPGGFDAEM